MEDYCGMVLHKCKDCGFVWFVKDAGFDYCGFHYCSSFGCSYCPHCGGKKLEV